MMMAPSRVKTEAARFIKSMFPDLRLAGLGMSLPGLLRR
jgi:hypothetical protein